MGISAKRASSVVSDEYTPLFRFCRTSSDFNATWDAHLPSIKSRIAELGVADSPKTLSEVKMAARRSVGL